MSILAFLPIFIAVTGGFFLWKLRAFFLLHPVRTFKMLHGAFSRDAASFRTLMLALAGTLGVGNITGVAVGMLLGGAGSVFWLLVSAAFATVLKYAESVLTAHGSHSDGMIGVIRTSLPAGRRLAPVYAFLCLGLSFSLGGALQCRATAGAAEAFYDFSPSVASTIFVLLLFFCFLGGAEKIMQKTAVLIPITAVMYIILCIITILSNITGLASALSLILSSAFSPSAAVSGVLGYLLSESVREGFCRGLLSNEAGAGTSTLAHAKNHGVTPAAEGVLGMCEVFFDTVLLCMLTALSLLLGAGDPRGYTDGFSYLAAAFSSSGFGAWRPVLLLCFFSFAVATSLCWYFYGEVALTALGGKKKRRTFYPFFFLVLTGVGGILSEIFLVRVCDLLLFFAGILSLAALLYGADTVRRETLAAHLMTGGESPREARVRSSRGRMCNRPSPASKMRTHPHRKQDASPVESAGRNPSALREERHTVFR